MILEAHVHESSFTKSNGSDSQTNTPNATLAVNDVLVAVDGQEVSEDNFVEKIRGSDMLGSRKNLTVDRNGTLLNVSVTRTSAGCSLYFRHVHCV